MGEPRWRPGGCHRRGAPPTLRGTRRLSATAVAASSTARTGGCGARSEGRLESAHYGNTRSRWAVAYQTIRHVQYIAPLIKPPLCSSRRRSSRAWRGAPSRGRACHYVPISTERAQSHTRS